MARTATTSATGPSSSPHAAAVTEATATLLWEACRRDPDPDAVRRALTGGADIGRAVSAAADHRVGPLLWRALDAAGALDALGSQRAVLGGMADAFRMEALLLLPRAVALAVRPLTDGGLEPLVFKGPAVAARYPAPGLRPMEDIDLLLPRRDHRRALAALGEAGWTVARAGGGDHYDTVAAARRGAVALSRTALRARAHVAAGDGARPGRAVGTPTAVVLRGDARLRVAAVRRAGGAGGARRQAPPRLRPADVDRRPGHDRRRRGGRWRPGRLGPRVRRGGRRPLRDRRRPRHSRWPDAPASSPRPNSSRCRHGAGGVGPSTACCR